MRSPVESSMSISRGFGLGRDLVRERDQRVGRLAHRRDGADDAQAALLGLDEAPRDAAHLLGVGDGRAAELHHDGVEGDVAARGHGGSVRVMAATQAVSQLACAKSLSC